MKNNRVLNPLLVSLVLLGVLASGVVPAHADDTDLFTSAVPPNVMLMVDNSGSMNNLVWHDEFDPTVAPTCANWSNTTTYWFNSNLTMTRCTNNRTLYADDTLEGGTWILGSYLNWYFSNESDPYFKGAANTDDDNLDGLANGVRSQCLQNEGLPATYSKYRRSRITASQEVLQEVICQVNEAGAVRFGLAQFYGGSDPQGGFVAVEIDDYTSSHADDISDFIEDLTGDTNTPLGETLYNVYRYFQSRTSPAPGVTTDFPAYNLELDGDTNSPTSSNVPPSPVTAECQKNFVVLITDGEPTRDDFDNMGSFFTTIGDYNADNLLPEAGNEELGNGAETAWYLDDIAAYMRNHDFQLDFPGDQLIDTYTVGFTTQGSANDILLKAATVGNGFFRTSNNSDELAEAIIDQIVDIIEKSQSFTSATVPASRTTEGDNFYATYFRPRADSPFWEGHLKNFKFTSSGDVLTGADKCAIGGGIDDPPCNNNGTLSTASDGVSDWGSDGDAATQIPAPASRTLKVGRGGATFGVIAPTFASMTSADFGLDTAGTGALTAAPYSLPSTPSSGQLTAAALDLQDNLAGCEFGTHVGVDCVTRTSDGVVSLLGDIFHSNPVVVGSPNSRINSPSYKLFASTFRNRDRVIYAGANDGFLRAFHAGEYKTEDPPGTPLNPPRHDRGTGTELFGFMPSDIRERMWEFPISQPTGSIRSMTTVDGSVIAADVWMYRANGTGTVLNPPVSTSKAMGQWRTVLVGALRDGGRSLYALDVTDPESAVHSNYPGYLWDFPCVDCATAVNSTTGTGATSIVNYMGNTWSEPVITRVKVAVSGQLGSHDRWVAIVGGGYDACGDPNAIGYFDQATGEVCDASDASKAYAGRAVFMVDITTGEVLGQKVFKPAASLPAPSANKGERGDMIYAFASSPAVFDINFDGYADVVYIGDLGGRMWKWVIHDTGDDPINDGTRHVGQPNWPFQIAFAASHSDAPSVGTDASHFQSFFYPPTGVRDGSGVILAWGSGERADPLAMIQDSEALGNNNHYYVVEDDDPYLRNTPVTLTESDLFDVTSFELGTSASLVCSDLGSEKGYYITGYDGEKFITNSVVFLGDVITGSYQPPSPSASICDSSGTANIYRFRLKCAVGNYPGTPRDKRKKTIGKGIPTQPRVSVGGLQKKGTDPCENRAVVVTSDGGLENDCIETLKDKVVELRSWRER